MGGDRILAMSIELDVRICVPGLNISDVIEAIEVKWDALCIGDSKLEFSALSRDSKELISEHSPEIKIDISDLASVNCDFYTVDPSDDDEGGLWGYVAVGIRNRESVFLMSITAAALAEIAESMIIDELELLESGRVIRGATIDQMATSVVGLSLCDAANAFVPHVNFGDPET
jgi:hypothetical protein